MNDPIIIALEIYLIAFVIAMIMAFTIKIMHKVTKLFSKEEKAITDK